MKIKCLSFLAALFFTTALTSQVIESPPPPPPPPPPPMEQEEIFKVVEQMPRFPGCEGQFKEERALKECAKESLMDYITGNLQYPAAAMAKGIEGMTVVQFIVEKDGSISNAKVLRDLGEGCGEAALAVINKMNTLPEKWTPGKQRGRAVKVLYTLPVKFVLPKPGQQQMEKEDVPKKTKINKKGMGQHLANPDGISRPPARTKKNMNNIVEEEPVMEDMPVMHDEPVFVDMEVAEEPAPQMMEEEVFKVVEQMPKFPGCQNSDDRNCTKDKLLMFLGKNLKYPAEARKKGVKGKVVVQFVIDKAGKVKNPTILRDIGAGCGQAALDAVNEMNFLPQAWTPGKQRGRAVNVQYTLPVEFNL